MRFEFVTSIVQLGDGDAVLVIVLNHSISQENARIRVFRDTADGAVQVADSRDLTVSPTVQSFFDFRVQSSGGHWVQIEGSSDLFVPSVSFQRFDGSVFRPITDYLPGDFAVFEFQRLRLR